MYGHPIGTAAQQDAAQQDAAAIWEAKAGRTCWQEVDCNERDRIVAWDRLVLVSDEVDSNGTRTLRWTTPEGEPALVDDIDTRPDIYDDCEHGVPIANGTDRISPTTNGLRPFEQSHTASPRPPSGAAAVWGRGRDAATGRPVGPASLARGVAARPSRSPSRFPPASSPRTLRCWPSLVPRAGRCGPPASGRRPYVFPLPSRRPILTAPHAEPSRARCARPAARQPSSSARCDASRVPRSTSPTARAAQDRSRSGAPRLAGCACALRVSQRTPGGPDRTAPGGGGGWSAGSVPATHSSRSVSPHRVDQKPPQYKEPQPAQGRNTAMNVTFYTTGPSCSRCRLSANLLKNSGWPSPPSTSAPTLRPAATSPRNWATPRLP